MKIKNLLIEEWNQEVDDYDNHDCKSGPDSGCQICADFMEKHHIPEPEGGEN